MVFLGAMNAIFAAKLPESFKFSGSWKTLYAQNIFLIGQNMYFSFLK